MDNNERKYILSVVTPFHNTDLAFFGKCLDSMKEQTLGFENIEWVITLHNSEPEYVEEVRGLCGEYENVAACAGAIARTKETVYPDPEITERYEAAYRKFRKIYPALKEVFPVLRQ